MVQCERRQRISAHGEERAEDVSERSWPSRGAAEHAVVNTPFAPTMVAFSAGGAGCEAPTIKLRRAEMKAARDNIARAHQSAQGTHRACLMACEAFGAEVGRLAASLSLLGFDLAT